MIVCGLCRVCTRTVVFIVLYRAHFIFSFSVFHESCVQAAVKSLKSHGGVCAKEVLGLCDQLRKDSFPKLGITAADGTTTVP